LDITQDSQTLGKPSMLDFVEGKVTIPYLMLHQRLKDKQKLELLYQKELTSDESSWIKLQMKETKALEDSIELARNLGLEAIEAIKSENNKSLVQIMNAMIEREF